MTAVWLVLLSCNQSRLPIGYIALLTRHEKQMQLEKPCNGVCKWCYMAPVSGVYDCIQVQRVYMTNIRIVYFQIS